MKNFLFVSSATIILSSCGIFDWTSNKSKEWGNSLPVSNEQKRCVNTWFCGSENSGGAATQQQYMQTAPQSAPAATDEGVRRSKYYNPAYPSTYQPETQGLPSPVAPQSYNNAAPMNAAQTYAAMQQQQGAVPVSYAASPVAPIGYANAPQQYAAPMPVSYQQPAGYQPVMPQAPVQAQQAIAGAPPGAIIPPGLEVNAGMGGEANMAGGPNMGSQVLLNEAAKDPRLQGFEANPDWANKKEEE